MASSLASAEPSTLDPTIGYDYGNIETPRLAGTSGALRALSTSTSALFINPANIALGRLYHLGVLASIWPEARRQSYGAAATDSLVSAARLAAGLGATYNIQDTDGVDRKWTDLRFALAYPFSDAFLVGLGGRYLWLEQNGVGPLGQSLASSGLPGQQIVRNFSFDAGVTVRPTAALAIALVGTNLADPGHGFMPLTVGGGVGYGHKQISAEADVVVDFTTNEETSFRASVGLESLLIERLALRGGYRYDDGAGNQSVSLGAGYISREFLLDLSVRRSVSGAGYTAVTFGFTYHLESSGLTPSAVDTF